MAKRMVSMIFIVLGISVFLVVSFFTVLLLAPGFEAFGLKYVTIDVRAYNSGSVRILDEMNKLGYDTFTGSIIVEADEVPIEIDFYNGYDYKVHYYENFCGYTKTDIDYPSLEVKRDKLGNAVIKATGFRKWVFENSNTKRFLKISIPLADMNVNGNLAYDTSLIINSVKSPIHFSFEPKDNTGLIPYIPAFKNVEIKTNGKIQIDEEVRAETYKLTTDNSIIIDEKTKDVVQASNYSFVSRLGRVTMNKPVTGDFSAKTHNYDIRLISCRNLTAETEYGDVVCAKKDSKINLTGMAYISTKTGNVELGKVEGGAFSEITTTSGNVRITKIKDANITTKRGSVKIDSLNEAKIETNMGKVTVQEVLSKIDVKTKRGNIVLGGEGMMMNNPTAFTRIGRISVLSASGNVKLETIKNDISFTNSNATNIKIVSGGKLTATKLTGKVEISAEENATFNFSKITDDVTIKLGDKCKQATINAVENSRDDTQYVISGKLVTRYEDNDNGTGTYSKMESSTDISNRLSGSEPYLKVTGKKTDIAIYFAAEEEN